MARVSGTSIDNTFIGGLNTQATGLNFPENAVFDENNCIFSERGFVSRRLGMEFEQNYALKTINRSLSAVTTFYWRNVTGDGTTNFVVQQVGSTLYFYNSDSNTGISAGALSANVDFSSMAAPSAPSLITQECQYAIGIGYLLVTHPYCDPFYIVYNVGSNDFTATKITVQIRDFAGVTDDVSSVASRPGSLSSVHNYNLLNQGWPPSNITTWHTSQSNYPSNADVWWEFKNTSDVFDPTVQANISLGNTPAPKGFYILSAFNQDRATISGIGGLTTVTSSYYRPSTVAFFAGRAFYAGVNYSGFTSKIYFSQIIDQTTQLGYCYQSSDPTSEASFDLLPSDGGVINIPNAGTIYKIISMGSNLIVYAANGVWTISGSSQVGFAANDYTVNPLSNIRSISGTSFVDLVGAVAWWNTDGIQLLSPTQDGSGGLAVQSLTDLKIKLFYADIPFISKQQARGIYNPVTHVIQWLFRSVPSGSVTDIYEYDSVLNFNTLSGAFYSWTFSGGVKVNSVIVAETGGSSNINILQVIDTAVENVQDNSGNNVISSGLATSAFIHTTTKFLVSYTSASTYKFTFAEAYDAAYQDWTIYDTIGTDYTSYFITGYKLRTQGERKFQVNYLFVFADSTSETQYKVQSLWDFATSGDTGRWSSPQIVSHTNTDYTYTRRRLMIRGQGQAVQFKFSSITGEPFSLIGWATYDTANQGI